jgi:hypothetical protein
LTLLYEPGPMPGISPLGKRDRGFSVFSLQLSVCEVRAQTVTSATEN